jgi:small subunit ribosomal protein S16
VVSDSRNTPTAAAIEEIGHYDPTKQPAQVTIDTARAEHWVGRGAQMSPTVKKLVNQTKKKSA